MFLHKIKLSGMKKGIKPKNVCEKPRKESPSLSPTSTLTAFDMEGGESDDANYRTPDLGRSSSTNPQKNIPADVPKGFFVVYVGEECRRYVIPLKHLKHQPFLTLLSRAEEEFGYRSGLEALRLPCDDAHFDQLLSLL